MIHQAVVINKSMHEWVNEFHGYMMFMMLNNKTDLQN